MRASVVHRVALSLVVLWILGGCADSVQPVPSVDPAVKAGANTGPVAIRIADSQFRGRPSNLPLDEFKRQVESGSGGSMTVDIVTDASADADPPNSEPPVIDKLRKGGFQMAVVPARAWSAAGVTSLKALQAPLAFASDAHVAGVLQDPSITRDLLSGFDGSEVTALTLYPESLRHLFSFGDPMLTPANVKGRRVQAIASLETQATVEALGGHAVYLSDADFQHGIDAGTIDAIESGFVLSAMTPSNLWSTATGNVPIYAKVMTIVANTTFWTSLSERQRAIVQHAAEATRDWAIANHETEADAARAFCKGGGRVVLADPVSTDAFRKAEAPVSASLAQDPLAKRVLAAMAASRNANDPSGVAACEPAQRPGVLEPEGGALPNGKYRIEATAAYLMPKYPEYVPEAVGVYLFTLDDGNWSLDYTGPDGGKDPQHGTYQVHGQRLKWRWDPCCNKAPNLPEDATWSVDRDATLHFVQLSGPTDWALELPWPRVGDLP
jgi:TRAP-type C4-dicarboxylate transport system substrate-binding protein